MSDIETTKFEHEIRSDGLTRDIRVSERESVSLVRRIREGIKDLLNLVKLGQIVNVSPNSDPVIASSTVIAEFFRVPYLVVIWTEEFAEDDDVWVIRRYERDRRDESNEKTHRR
jgi:hypothetical protein